MMNELSIKAPSYHRTAEYYCFALLKIYKSARKGKIELNQIMYQLYGGNYEKRLSSRFRKKAFTTIKVDWDALSPPLHLQHFFTFLAYNFGTAQFTEREFLNGWKMFYATTHKSVAPM